jgi:hypothetical protein
MQTFDDHQVSFVSVTQQFNTTTSMGRLTLNMLLSFAQFEREVAGERIRDKIAATKRKGLFVGGVPPHSGTVHQGHHQPIIDQATWDSVHARMGTIERESRHKWTHTHLLKGKIRTSEGHAMSPGSVQRPVSKRDDCRRVRGDTARRIVRYYVSQKAVKQGFKTCPIKTINASHIDDLIRGLVFDHLKNHHHADLRGQQPESRDRWIREVVHRVVVAPDRITVELTHERIAAYVDAARDPGTSRATSANTIPTCPFTPEIEDRGKHLTLTLRIQIKRHDGRRVLLSPDGHDLLTTITPDGRPVARDHLVRAIGLAFAWRCELLRTHTTVESVAQRAGLTAPRVHAMLNLTQLSPTILRSVLTGTLGASVTLADLLRAAKHLDWSRQSRALGA